jgi:hypothetical protein
MKTLILNSMDVGLDLLLLKLSFETLRFLEIFLFIKGFEIFN